MKKKLNNNYANCQEKHYEENNNMVKYKTICLA